MGNCISVNQPFKHLENCEEVPDVTLVVEETEIPAHRSILSKQSDYFEAMFSNNFLEASSDKITLNETNLKAFKRVLEFIYTGDTNYEHKIPLTEVFEMYLCAQFYLVDSLKTQMFSHLTSQIHPMALLDYALAYSIDELIAYVTDLILSDAFGFSIYTFDEMSPRFVEYVLKLPLNVPASVIFDTLLRWMRRSPKYSFSFAEFLKLIELHLLDEVQLNKLFKPKKLIDRSFVENLLSEQQELANVVEKVENQNVINDIKDFRIMAGRKTRSGTHLSASWENCITIDLKKRFLLNCFKFKLISAISYTVSVSNNIRDWECVTDYSKYNCSGQQVLYFTERAVRFIRIQCVAEGLKIGANIEALYSTHLPEVDPITTAIVPNYNIMPPKMLHNHTSGSWICGTVMNNRLFHGYIKHDVNGEIIYRFSQPYIIGSIKLLFKSETCYTVTVAVETDQYTTVFSEDSVNGWRVATFPKQPVLYIRIEGINAPSGTFHLYALECPAT